MGLLSRLKKATGLESVREPCVQPKHSLIMTKNSQPAPVGAVETDGGRKEAGREEDKKSFWKWPALHFPSCRTGTYDLAKAEKKYRIETGTHRAHTDGQSEHEPCVKPKDTPTRSNNRHLPDEAPVGAFETDGGRKEAGREEEKKKKSLWKWPALHFPSCRTGTYDLVQAEKKYKIETGTHRTHTDGQSEHEPCVQPKDTPTRSNNRHLPDEAPVGAFETDGGRKEAGREEKKKKKSLWKWPALHFPSCRTGTYDLVQAEKKYRIETGTHQTHTDAPAPEVLPTAEEQQILDILDKGQSEHEPCVQPKDTPTRSNNRHLPDEAPVGAVETDGGRKEAGREEKKKKKKSLWKWPALHFPSCRTGTYDLVQAEKKYKIEMGTHWTHTDGQSEHEPCVQPKDTPTRSNNRHLPDEAPVGAFETDGGRKEGGREEVLLTAEEQLMQDILDKGHIHKQYKIGRKLGEGGCGIVYEGTRCKDGLKVAVKLSMKMPNTPSIRVPDHPKRLPMEIGLMLMANKGPSVPQIIELLDWEDDTEHYVMVMELPMPCVDLFSFVDQNGGSLDERTARNIMRQVIDAAKTCCERGVFHRDIKLENLLVNQDTMEVKLIDFGCGALMKKSAFKVFRGTRGYCPPEFNMKGKYHAKPTTVWTLGFILYEMVCGECPTPYDRHMITVNLWTRPGLSQECCKMICDCLQPDPQQRLVLEKMHLHDWFKVTE